jgi:hypothetical protein
MSELSLLEDLDTYRKAVAELTIKIMRHKDTNEDFKKLEKLRSKVATIKNLMGDIRDRKTRLVTEEGANMFTGDKLRDERILVSRAHNYVISEQLLNPEVYIRPFERLHKVL